MALGQNNVVRIVKVGEGQPLPREGLLGGGQAVVPPDVPSEIQIICGPSEIQMDLPLEPVMLDLDGAVKRPNKISFMPRPNGWDGIDPFSEPFPVGAAAIALGVGPGDIQRNMLFRLTFARWFRVATPLTLDGPPVKGNANLNPVNDLYRILPLNSSQLRKVLRDPVKDVGGAAQQKQQDEKNWDTYQAWVWGVFWGGDSRSGNNVDKADAALLKDPDPDLDTKPKGIYAKEWELDTEHGIVKFADPVMAYVNSDKATGFKTVFPKLWLRTSFSVKTEDTLAPVHFVVKRKVPGPKTSAKPLVIIRPDLVAKYIYVGINGKVIFQSDNEKEMTTAANIYIDAELKKLRIDTPATADYAGFLDLDTDGSLQQVTWKVDDSGAAITTVARNTEQLTRTPSYEELRFNQKTKSLLDEKAAQAAAARAAAGKKK